MRADRLLSILLTLQVRQSITARELAQRLEVSERTIHRDMEALGAAGVPVVAERGASGGWRLLEEYRTNLTGLNESEARALFLAGPPRLLADLGLERAADTALIKLLAAMPSLARRDAEFARERIHVDGAGWMGAKEPVPLLPVVQEALWQERKLRIAYRRNDSTIVERTIDPLGLVAKGSVWYLVAGIEEDIRTYRVARLQAASVADEACERPENFDLAAHWEQSSQAFRAHLPRYPAVVRVGEEMVPALRLAAFGKWARIQEIGPPDEKGRVVVDILFELEDNAREYALSFGPQIEVLEPADLRDQVRRAAEGIVALYARSSQ